jgi:hypothetical protein
MEARLAKGEDIDISEHARHFIAARVMHRCAP